MHKSSRGESVLITTGDWDHWLAEAQLENEPVPSYYVGNRRSV